MLSGFFKSRLVFREPLEHEFFLQKRLDWCKHFGNFVREIAQLVGKTKKQSEVSLSH
jgi:hypothetical protein